jgi:hypothetical protein
MTKAQFKRKLQKFQDNIWYSVFMLVAVAVAAVLVIYELAHKHSISPGLLKLSQDIDFYISFMFMLDFLITLYIVPQKLKYIFSFDGFMNFITAYPFNNATYRALRVLRFTRVIRGIQAALQGEQVVVAHQEAKKRQEETK